MTLCIQIPWAWGGGGWQWEGWACSLTPTLPTPPLQRTPLRTSWRMVTTLDAWFSLSDCVHVPMWHTYIIIIFFIFWLPDIWQRNKTWLRSWWPCPHRSVSEPSGTSREASRRRKLSGGLQPVKTNDGNQACLCFIQFKINHYTWLRTINQGFSGDSLWCRNARARWWTSLVTSFIQQPIAVLSSSWRETSYFALTAGLKHELAVKYILDLKVFVIYSHVWAGLCDSHQ